MEYHKKTKTKLKDQVFSFPEGGDIKLAREGDSLLCLAVSYATEFDCFALNHTHLSRKAIFWCKC